MSAVTDSMMYIMYENSDNIIRDYFDKGLITLHHYIVNTPEYGKKWIDDSVNAFSGFKFNYSIKKQFYPFQAAVKNWKCIGFNPIRELFYYEKEENIPSFLVPCGFNDDVHMYMAHIPFRNSELKKLTDDDKKILKHYESYRSYFRLHCLQTYNIYEGECDFYNDVVIIFNKNHDVLIGSYLDIEKKLPAWVSKISEEEFVKKIIL